MAKASVNIDALSRQLIEQARRGEFSSVYLLMGDEPYYPDLVCDAIIESCIPEEEKDFNETVCYGSDVDADAVVSAARRYPMMAERQLVVLKEAQLMKDIEKLQYYCAQPLDSTVFVVLLHRASVDKRKAFYKSVQKTGVVLESPQLRDYEISEWIIRHFAERGVKIDPRAAALMGESVGTDLCAIAVEADKMLKNLPEGASAVSVEDVERNVGVSRQFSIFELTKALSLHDAAGAVRIATYVGSGAKFAMPQATAALFTHFYRILRYGALLAQHRNPSPEDKARVLAGVNPYFYREYDTAVRNYPLPRCMRVISLLREYDYRGKGGDGGDVDGGQMLLELVVKILNV
ncbi:MAG: DNA polymerase III subunit delta [Bacteroidia bacterium]|nr:DNA polymerase III subunit delta [Bacteroidia bacterium]